MKQYRKAVRVLLLEDQPAIANPVRRALEASGYAVRLAQTLREAQGALLEAEFDLLVLDVRLPDADEGGFSLARTARTGGFRGRILFMTARDALDDRVAGLDMGADDYVVKPFELPELLARVRALLRRDSDATSSLFVRGRLSFDLVHREPRWDGAPVAVTPREQALLERLVLNADRTLSSEQLMDAVWGEQAQSGVVKVAVHHLRQKLAADAIVTASGRGYRLGPCLGQA